MWSMPLCALVVCGFLIKIKIRDMHDWGSERERDKEGAVHKNINLNLSQA